VKETMGASGQGRYLPEISICSTAQCEKKLVSLQRP